MTGYLTVRETAEVLNMHFMSVYKLVQTGQLPALKIGCRWKIDSEQLDDWLAQRRAAPPRRWLLLSRDDLLGRNLAGALPAGHHLSLVDYARLSEALDERPAAVLIDPLPDAGAAVAALDYCQAHDDPPMAVWLLRPHQREPLAPAWDLGLLTVLALPPSSAALARLAALLPLPRVNP